MFPKTSHLLVALLVSASIPVMAQNLAVVNGKAIPASRADAIVKQIVQQGQQDTPELRAFIKERLIDNEILVQQANKLGLAKKAEVKAQLDESRQTILIQALVADYLKKHPVKEATIKAEYDKFHEEASKEKDYRARHILVEKEDEAKAIITKLKGGAKFEELAKQSKDKGTVASGGDLDWLNPSRTNLAKEFAEALLSMQKGQLLETPVKTQFGYHVIRLDDVRAATVPKLEEIKPQFENMIRQRELQAYQQELRSKATIK